MRSRGNLDDEVMTREGDLLGDKSHGILVQRLLLLLWRHQRDLLRCSSWGRQHSHSLPSTACLVHGIEFRTAMTVRHFISSRCNGAQ